MSSEQAVRDEMVSLLRYANLTAIGRELGVSAQAVKNWANGKNTSPARLAQVRRLYGLPIPLEGQNERAAPSMTRRPGVIALERRADISPDELLSAQDSATAIEAAMEVDARIAAELEASRHRSVERAAGRDGGQSAGSQDSTRQTR